MGGLQDGGGRSVLNLDGDRVEVARFGDPVPHLLQALCECRRQSMNPLGDPAQAIGSMIDRVHAGHDGEKHLRGADVARRLVATDVLLTGLNRQSIGGSAGGVLGDADQTSG